MSVKFYCETCNENRSVIIESITQDELNDHPWGDIVCKKCHFVIATISADEEGTYGFVKVEDVS